MKNKILIAVFLFIESGINSLEYLKQLENDKVCVSYVKIMPQEEIGLHYDVLPQVVLALEGGVITCLSSEGVITEEVSFPTGEAVYRPKQTPAQIHKSVNRTNKPIVLIITQLKD